MINEKEILDLLEKKEAVITNSHIVYTSGRHGSTYFNKDAIYPHTHEVSKICLAIAEHFIHKDIQAVVAPAIGGVILSQWIAFHLSQLPGMEVLALYAEKAEDNTSFILKRGYDKLIKGKNVLVVEDVLTTGNSAKKVVEAAKKAETHIVGVAVLCNRGKVNKKDLGDVPKLFSLIDIDLESWDEDSCPLCEQGIPVNMSVGKGREFLLKKKS